MSVLQTVNINTVESASPILRWEEHCKGFIYPHPSA